VQARLLALQEVDSEIAQLHHRRRTLPEHAELQRLRSVAEQLTGKRVAADTAVSDLEADQARAESDLEPVRERLARNERRIADGTVADPKALASMIEEVDHLRKRISDLEDAELETMEQLESAAAERDRLQNQLGEVEQSTEEVTRRRDAELAVLDAKVAEAQNDRAGLAPDIPADLMTLYAKLAATHNGVGAAELRQRRCTGCQLEINAADLEAIAAAAPQEVLRCEECGRILIRTERSGLHR
jgi:uncharacterized protein